MFSQGHFFATVVPYAGRQGALRDRRPQGEGETRNWSRDWPGPSGRRACRDVFTAGSVARPVGLLVSFPVMMRRARRNATARRSC